MNLWLMAGVAVASSLVLCAFMCLRGTPERRLVGVEMTSMIVITTMVLFTVGTGRLIFIDLPLTLAILSFGGGLVFVRFLGKYL
ncbi:MAG TPA: monovalent cation/H+ antiporter complex subunit F [Bryocella sp.]|nr:monovalent cation/H+ antiporter complex subunit F [Bryocella sp.]